MEYQRRSRHSDLAQQRAPLDRDQLQARPRDLASDSRGAMWVMGIPLIFFMIALLYFVIGLGEELVLRERMQDAADAGAITGAIVYARCMNLIALLNQVMAALVALLIMVRLLEGAMTATILIAGALAWPTAGASLSVVPGAEAAREEANTAYEELSEIVKPIVEIIHAVEIGIQYGSAVIAELQTRAIIGSFGNPVTTSALPGFEIPGEPFLPLKNGRWPRLCEKAGGMVGDLIALPLETIIPVPAVHDVVSGAVEGLTSTFSSYFCDSGSAGGLTLPENVPAVPLPDTKQFEENIPRLEKADQCEAVMEDGDKDKTSTKTPAPSNGATPTLDDLTHKLTETQKADRAAERDKAFTERDAVCRAAAEELAMSDMAQDGGPTGQGLVSAKTNKACGYTWSNKTVYNCPADCRATQCAPFRQKVAGAYDVCQPGKTDGVVSYNYQQRDLQWEVELVPLPGCKDPSQCRYSVKYVTPEPVTVKDVGVVKNPKPPCGKGGTIGEQYVKAAYRPDGRYTDEEYLCAQPHNYVDPSEFETDSGAATSGYTLAALQQKFGTDDPSTSGWTLTTDRNGQPKLTGAWSAVTYMHSCEKKIENLADLNRKMAPPPPKGQPKQNECEDSQDEVHLEMEDAQADNVLGGKIYQIRAIAFRREREGLARDIVRTLPVRSAASMDQDARNPFGAAGNALGKLFAAQAEYYFDSDYAPHPDAWDQTAVDRQEWTWQMKWHARLRRLRFLGDDDEDSSCAGEWPSRKGQKKNKPKDKCSNSGGGNSGGGNAGSAIMQAVGIDPEAIEKQFQGMIQDMPSFEDQMGQVLNDTGTSLQSANVPGAGGSQQQKQGNSGQGDACGSISATRQLESLMIH